MNPTPLPAGIERLVQTLKQELSADVEVERVSGSDSSPARFRLGVVSPKFESLTHLQRQDLLWELVDRVLNREEAFSISLILAFSPSEMGDTAQQET